MVRRWFDGADLYVFVGCVCSVFVCLWRVSFLSDLKFGRKTPSRPLIQKSITMRIPDLLSITADAHHMSTRAPPLTHDLSIERPSPPPSILHAGSAIRTAGLGRIPPFPHVAWKLMMATPGPAWIVYNFNICGFQRPNVVPNVDRGIGERGGARGAHGKPSMNWYSHNTGETALFSMQIHIYLLLSQTATFHHHRHPNFVPNGFIGIGVRLGAGDVWYFAQEW